MNEILAENRFMLNKDLFTEGMRRVWAENSGKSTKKLLAVLALVWLALSAYTLIRGGSLGFPVIELFVLSLTAFWATVWLPRSGARRAYRALEASGRADTERIVRFYADRLEAEANGQLTGIAYADIVQILTTPRLLILLAEDKTGILLRRDSFVLGTEEQVLTLIQKEKELHD